MKLTASIKLLPTTEQAQALLVTLERINAACNWLARWAFMEKTADKLRLHGTSYRTLREQFGLSAQMAVRVIGKVCDTYKRDRKILPVFDLHGAVPYDQRILSFKALDRVSILTLDGRQTIPYVTGDYHRARMQGICGQSDLILKNGGWYLYVTVQVPETAPVEPQSFLGVDFGIRNLATDSDGIIYSGANVEAVSIRIHTLRTALQSAGSKSAKRHLKRLGSREARFRKNVNHVISKALVYKAKGTKRGIAIEDLKGIRERITVNKSQRAMHSRWAFSQLRSFVTYKAKLAGVVVIVVDPHNTSRECPSCGFTAKENRRSQASFLCKSCGFRDHADIVGAMNIARRATINWPIVSTVKCETCSHDTSLRSGTSY